MFESVEQLERRLASTTNRAERVVTLVDLSYALVHSDPERARVAIVEAFADAEQLDDTLLLGRVLRASASIDMHCSENDAALETLQHAFALAEDTGDVPGEAHSLRIIGNVYKGMGESGRALLYQHRALEIYQTLGDEEGEGGARNDIGNCYKSLGDFTQALEHQLVSLDIAHRRGNRLGEASALNNIGNIYYELRDLHKALEYYTRSLAIKETLGDLRALGNSYGNIGLVHGALDDSDRAIEFHTQSLDYFRRCADRQGESNSLCNLATVWSEVGDGERALQYGRESLAIASQIGDREGESVSLRGIGRAQMIMGDPHSAIENFREALVIASDLGIRPLEFLLHSSLFEATRAVGDSAVAFAHQSEAFRIREQISSRDAQQTIHNRQLLHDLERARAEAEIERLKNVELARTLEDLHAAQLRLVQAEKMAYIGHLTSGVTDQAREPIEAIDRSLAIVADGAAELLSLAGDSLAAIASGRGDPATLARSIAAKPVDRMLATVVGGLATIEQEAVRTALVVEGLRSFARLDEGALKLADLHDGIIPLLTLVRSRCRGRITIDFLPGDISPIECYPGLINQALLAIISEGIERIDGEGEITIRTEQRDGHVALAISRQGEEHTIDSHGESMETPAIMIMQEVAEKHAGELLVDRADGRNIDITMILPISRRSNDNNPPTTGIPTADATEQPA